MADRTSNNQFAIVAGLAGFLVGGCIAVICLMFALGVHNSAVAPSSAVIGLVAGFIAFRYARATNDRMELGDTYRLIFAGCGWIFFLWMVFFSGSSLTARTDLMIGTGCILAAYTIFAIVIWRKNPRR